MIAGCVACWSRGRSCGVVHWVIGKLRSKAAELRTVARTMRGEDDRK